MTLQLTIDILTLILTSVLLVLTIVSMVSNAFFRRIKTSDVLTPDESAHAEQPKVSIVITADDQARELERNLPALLEQDYPKDRFEVVVVVEYAGEETNDLLKLMKARYDNLYTTFIPDSSHYLSRRKLALTVGIKAAKYEWILMTDADCRPDCPTWLQTMARYMRDDVDVVTGLTGYAAETPTRWHLDRLLTNCYQMRRAAKGTAYRYDGRNLAFRKQKFMEQNGFLANLKYLRGEYDFMVNEMACPGNTAIVLEPEARMTQDYPSRKSWTNDHLYYMETRKHLHRSFHQRLVFNVDQWMLHLSYLTGLAVIVWSVFTAHWVLTATASLLLTLMLIIRTTMICRAAQDYDARMECWKAPWLELRIVWQNALLILKYRRADKYDFIRR